MEFIISIIIIALLAVTLIIAGYAIISFVLIGAVILGIVCFVIKIFVVPYFENRKAQRLDNNHIMLYAQKQRVRIDYNQKINNMNPFVIDCLYTDENTGREFCFTSKPFMTDPSPYIRSMALPIFVNPEDYSNYYVDTSQIPN